MGLTCKELRNCGHGNIINITVSGFLLVVVNVMANESNVQHINYRTIKPLLVHIQFLITQKHTFYISFNLTSFSRPAGNDLIV